MPLRPRRQWNTQGKGSVLQGKGSVLQGKGSVLQGKGSVLQGTGSVLPLALRRRQDLPEPEVEDRRDRHQHRRDHVERLAPSRVGQHVAIGMATERSAATRLNGRTEIRSESAGSIPKLKIESAPACAAATDTMALKRLSNSMRSTSQYSPSWPFHDWRWQPDLVSTGRRPAAAAAAAAPWTLEPSCCWRPGLIGPAMALGTQSDLTCSCVSVVCQRGVAALKRRSTLSTLPTCRLFGRTHELLWPRGHRFIRPRIPYDSQGEATSRSPVRLSAWHNGRPARESVGTSDQQPAG